MNTTLYDKDYHLWLHETVQLLQQGNLNDLDINNLIEEIQDTGRREKDALESNLIVVFKHLLKWKYQPEKQSGNWRGSIREHRRRILKALKNSPSLKPYLMEIWDESYQEARKQAADETELSLNIFPETCPFSVEQILDAEYLPN